MSLLSDVESQRVPRSEDVALAVGKKIEAGYKLVIFGVVWLVTVADILALIFMFGTIGIMRALGTHKGEMVESVLGLVAFGVSQIIAWTWFARWVRKLRERALAVGREGKLYDALVYKVSFYRGQTVMWRWTVDIEGRLMTDSATFIGLPPDAADRQKIKVLAIHRNPYALMFSTPEGHVTRLRRDKHAIRERNREERESA